MGEKMRKKNDEKHLCALDCKHASSCRWVLAKKKDKDPNKFPGLVVKKNRYRDSDRYLCGYKVVECPHYELDERSSIGKVVVKPEPKKSNRWTDDDMLAVAKMYGKHTYAEIASAISRPEGSLYRIVKILRERGAI